MLFRRLHEVSSHRMHKKIYLHVTILSSGFFSTHLSKIQLHKLSKRERETQKMVNRKHAIDTFINRRKLRVCIGRRIELLSQRNYSFLPQNILLTKIDNPSVNPNALGTPYYSEMELSTNSISRLKENHKRNPPTSSYQLGRSCWIMQLLN